jgi:hypothetical protein
MASHEQDQEVVARSPQPNSLVEFLRKSPLVGVELDLERQTDEGRDIELAKVGPRFDEALSE